MNRIFNTSMTVCLAALALSACTQDELTGQGTPLPEPVPLVLNVTGLDVVAAPVTRGTVDDNTWDEGTEVALCEGEGKPVMTYKIEGGKLTPKGEANTIWWNYNAEKKSLTAWYPRTTLDGEEVAMPADGGEWTVPSIQSTAGSLKNADLLYANGTVYFTDRQNASLTFRHLLAKVVININSSDYLKGYSPDDVTVTMENILVNGTFQFSPGTNVLILSADYKSEEEEVKPYKCATASGKFATYEALLMPQSANDANRRIIVQVGNTRYAWTIVMKIPNWNDTFDGGMQYTYNITVDAKGLNVSVESSIAWTTEGGATGAGSVTLP